MLKLLTVGTKVDNVTVLRVEAGKKERKEAVGYVVAMNRNGPHVGDGTRLIYIQSWIIFLVSFNMDTARGQAKPS